jgi:hypothetical protein
MIPVAILAAATIWLAEESGSPAPDAGHPAPDAGSPMEAAPEPGPGEPRPDPSLAAGVLTVELVDAQGAPLPRATLSIESMDAAGERKRLEAETDARGHVRVADLPHGGSHRLLVGHLSGGDLLTSSRPFQLGPDRGARLRLVVPERTPRADVVAIDRLHAVLDREGSRIRVTETINLASRDGTLFSNPRGLLLRLPEGASGPRLAEESQAGEQVRVTESGFLVTAPISPAGVELTLVFQVPIEDGRARFEQAFPLPVSTARVISTWTAGETSLHAEGCSPAAPAQLQNGLTALVASGRDLDGKRLTVTLAGVADGPAGTRRILAFVLSALLLALGLALWIGRRVRSVAGGEDGPA